MGKIRVLAKEVSELIAAGEVIERPASVVKELVENAVDAGASQITIEIKKGGASYIRVTDNGSGMEKEDAPAAFLRHATSKVQSRKDLDQIGTLGFRGEALASIAAVSKISLLTKVKGEALGTLVQVAGGEIQHVDDAGCPDGTTIAVQDLFYNVPARLKFLKKDITEGNAVASIVEKIALSHPEIGFRFLRDNKAVFQTPGNGDLKSAVYAVLGRDFANHLIPVDYRLQDVGVTGFVTAPSFHRANRSLQHFFINGRYVKSRTAMVALEEGFRGSLMVGKFPSCVLMLTMPFSAVDVNVHPTKTEVRFVSEKSVFDCVYFAVKSALQKENQDVFSKKPKEAVLTPFFDPEPKNQETLFSPPSFSSEKKETANDFKPASSNLPPKREDALLASFSPPEKPQRRVSLDVEVNPEDFLIEETLSDNPTVYQAVGQKTLTQPLSFKALPSAPDRAQPDTKKIQKESVREVSFRYLGEIFSTYLLAETGDHFILVDKHAAHERILYNRLVENHEYLEKQLLLSGSFLSMTAAEREELEEKRELLEQMGFEFEEGGRGTVLLKAAPSAIGDADPKEVFLDVAAALKENRRLSMPKVTEEILHRIACRSAIKANDQNNGKELQEIVRRVLSDPEVRYCPHGRPVLLTFSRKELEKLFGRLG